MTPVSPARKPVDLVVASAGTGKTARLIGEIRTAIDGGTPANSILATTFTNKAAGELVERARAGLISDGRADPATDLLTARVGTINATFGKIVGEFALEAGRSPVADVVAEQRQKRIFAISAEAAIASSAGTLIPIAQRLEIENWQDQVLELSDRARQNGIEPAELEGHAGRSWAGLRAILPDPTEEAGDALEQRLRAALVEARDALAAANDQTKTTARAKKAVADAVAILDSGRELSWSRWAALSKVTPAKSSLELVHPVVEIAARHASNPALHADLEAYILGIYRTAADALAMYAQFKAANGLVDFIDQEREALRLLDDPAVAARLQETLTRAFVDEFQDTSPIQLDLFLRLSQIAERSFWVGDPKQAIYGFRGADPELIVQAAEKIVGESGGERGTLDTSYRARPDLVGFANHVFGPAFDALGFDPQSVRIETCARDDGDGQAGPVEIWRLAGRRADQADAALAQQVGTVLADPGAYLVRDRSTRELRAIRGADIAILCRSNDHCSAVGAALAAAGIRASIARPGLLETSEAVLALAALRYLLDPADDLAIAEIAHLCSDADGQPSWFARSLSDGGIRSLRTELPVLAALDAERAGLAYWTPREALEAAIAASGVLDRVRTWKHPLDRMANLDALRGLATQYEDEARTIRGAATAAGLVAWLSQAVGPDDALPASGAPDAVHVLSYHRAKGLEWPMVVLSDLHSARAPSAFGFHVDVEGDFDVWQPLKGRWVRFWPWPYGRQRTGVHIDSSVLETAEHREVERREHSEAVRLLYVGVTRARDYLVLAARHNAKAGLQVAWVDRLVGDDGMPVVDVERVALEGCLRADGTAIPVRSVDATAGDPSAGDEAGDGHFQVPAVTERADRPPYRIVPSRISVEGGDTAVVVSRIALGGRIPISGSPDMNALGEAVHAFLAVDRPDQTPDERRARAVETLARWSVGELTPDQLVEMGDRLFAHLATAYPGMAVRAEVPVFGRQDGQRLHGRVDLLLRDESRAIVIDHKSFPGGFDAWEGKALATAPQLWSYGAVVRAATRCRTVETWVHMPVVGQLIWVGRVEDGQT